MEKENVNCFETTEGINGTKGYTLVELITVLAITAILGTMLVSMLNIGVQFYRTANSAMENQNNARLAIAYITVKVRQNDVVIPYADNKETETYGVSVTTTAGIQGPVLKIYDASNAYNASNISENNFFWIYFYSDKLLEHRETGTVPNLDPINDTEITDLSYFNIEQSGANLHFEVKSVDGSVDLTQDITLRASP